MATTTYNEFKTGMVGMKVQIKLFPLDGDGDTPEVTSVGVLAAYTATTHQFSWAFQHRPDVGAAPFDKYRVEIEVFKNA